MKTYPEIVDDLANRWNGAAIPFEAASTAMHEAGHAVTGLAYGFPIRTVSIEEDEESLGWSGATQWDFDIDPCVCTDGRLRQYATMVVAGRVADGKAPLISEAIGNGSITSESATGHDALQAYRYTLKLLPVVPGPFDMNRIAQQVRLAENRARKLLKAHRASLVKLAETLLTSKSHRLSTREVSRLFS